MDTFFFTLMNTFLNNLILNHSQFFLITFQTHFFEIYAFKTQFMKKLSPAEKEELTKKIEAHSEAKTESWSGMVRELITKKRLKLK